MRIVIAALAPLIFASLAQAQPINGKPPTRTVQCVEVNGQLVPAVCRVPGTRLDPREFICTCPAGGLRVEVDVCPPGVEPPPESRALVAARRKGMAADGSLVGDQVEGRPICVAPRRP